MFKRLSETAAIDIVVDGKAVTAREGDTVAAAMLAAGLPHCRTTPVSDSPRAPYCLMGVCFECLVTIDGVGSRQACLIPVRAGMKVDTQLGRREAGR
jgi:predicted molibdopterin-dependent oxidoreductase YjgC